jgi:Mn2+/Fe2+ NRAMP family transporter
MANIGTTIAPWMIFFQQSAVVDKGMQEKDMLWGKIDTAIGSLLTVVVAAFCVILTATLIPGLPISDAATAAHLFMSINKYVGTFLAIGLFDAGLLGAICISLASSWAFGEVFGWAHSLNQNVKQAPWFYAYYFFTLVFAGAIVLIPGAPLRWSSSSSCSMTLRPWASTRTIGFITSPTSASLRWSSSCQPCTASARFSPTS